MKKLSTLYILMITEGISLIGSRMSSIAISIWLYQSRGSATYLLLIPLFNELPAILFGNLAGAAVDRWKRKYVMIFGDTGQALCSLILWLIIITNNFQVWQLFVLTFVQGTFSMLQGLAADASTFMLAPKEQLARVNAVKEMTFPVSGAAAPALSGFLYALSGLQGVILLDLITFVLSLIILLVVDIPDPVKNDISAEKEGTMLNEISGGFKYLSRCRGLFKLILYFSFINFMLNGPLELVIPYVLKAGGNQLLVSVILGVMNLGALFGALLIAIRGDIRDKTRLLMIGMIISGIMFITFGNVHTPAMLALSLFVLMIPLPVSNALFKSLIQTKTAPEVQGSVFAVVSQFQNIGSTLSFLLTGPLVDKVLEPKVNGSKLGLLSHAFGSRAGGGIGLLLTITGLIIVIITLLTLISPGIRQLDKKAIS